MSLTKAAMAERLFEELGLNKREAKDLVEQFFEEISKALESGENVMIKSNVREGTPRPVKRFLFQHAGWSHSDQVINSNQG